MSENTEKFNSHQALSALLDKHEGKIDPNTMFTYLSFLAFTSMMNTFPVVQPQEIPLSNPTAVAPNQEINFSNVLEKIQSDPASMTKIKNLFSGTNNSGLDTNNLSSLLSTIGSNTDFSSIIQKLGQGKGSNNFDIGKLAPLLSLLGNKKQNSLSGLLSGLNSGGTKGLDSNILEGLAPLADILGKNGGSLGRLSRFAPLLPLLDGFGSKKSRRGKKSKKGETAAFPFESLLALGGGSGSSSLGSMLPLLFLLGSGKSGLFKGFQGMLKPFIKK